MPGTRQRSRQSGADGINVLDRLITTRLRHLALTCGIVITTTATSVKTTMEVGMLQITVVTFSTE